jgi:hypoxanthine phosphoribosyltransferase
MPLKTLISEQQIQTRIAEMGAQIDVDYPDAGTLYLICILKGACFFMADLARAIQRDAFIDFMGISSYGRGKTSSGEVKITKDLDISIEGADVLIVEDIVDSGLTLSYLTALLKTRKPKSVRIAALLDKPERRIRPVDVAYVGFQIPDEFVVGYGLDCAEKYRNLRDVCILNETIAPAAVPRSPATLHKPKPKTTPPATGD